MKIVSCKNCGIIMDIDYVNLTEPQNDVFSDTYVPPDSFYICPLCKATIDEDGYDIDN